MEASERGGTCLWDGISTLGGEKRRRVMIRGAPADEARAVRGKMEARGRAEIAFIAAQGECRRGEGGIQAL